MEKAEIASKIDELDKKFTLYLNGVKQDGVMRTVFPNEFNELVSRISEHPTAPIAEYYSNRHSVLNWLAYFETFQKNLDKNVRAEKHDHHGLHLIIEEIISLIKQLL